MQGFVKKNPKKLNILLGASSGIFAKVCTSENFPLFSNSIQFLIHQFMAEKCLK